MPDSPHMMPIQPDGLESLHRSVGAVLDAEDVPPLGPNIGISQIKGTQSWHSLAAEHTVDLVLQGLGDRGLFESAGLEALETLTSLARAKAHPGIKRLLAAFEESGLAPQLGHNPSSQRISLTMPLPVQKQFKSMAGTRQAVVWCMLGLLPWQAKTEEWFHKLSAGTAGINGSSKGNAGASVNNEPSILANRCLVAFSNQTGAHVWDVRVDCERAMTVRLELGRPQRAVHFMYGPSYLMLSGRGEDGAFGGKSVQQGQSEVAASMAHDFWHALETGRGGECPPYVPCADLRGVFGGILEEYLCSGISDWRQGFSPSKKGLSVYLQGKAGCGKSSFVVACAGALQEALRSGMDPARKVAVVKVSLNCETPGHLKSIVSVRGLSDFSVERLVEQTICKDGTVILHLEEVPEDAGLQGELCEVVEGMMTALRGRYPAKSNNIIRIYTSNYPPMCSRLKEATAVKVTPPSAEGQELCASHLLQALLDLRCGGCSTVSSLSRLLPTPTPPPRASSSSSSSSSSSGTVDMRFLHKWCISAAYHVSTHVGSHRDLPLAQGIPLVVTMSNSTHCQAGEAFTVNAVIGGDALPPLVLACARDNGGLVYPTNGTNRERDGHSCSAEACGGSARDDGCADMEGPDGGLGLSSDDCSRVTCLLDMCMGKWLRPGVVVLSGGRSAAVERIVDLAKVAALRSGAPVRVERVGLRCEQDKSLVYGHASEIRGGLFKAIDDCTNENNAGDLAGCACIVVCEVNQVGEYMLRELLDSSELSTTHRFAIRKDKVLFVVAVEGGEPEEMTISRAHLHLSM